MPEFDIPKRRRIVQTPLFRDVRLTTREMPYTRFLHYQRN
jgi:hypothetical protein